MEERHKSGQPHHDQGQYQQLHQKRNSREQGKRSQNQNTREREREEWQGSVAISELQGNLETRVEKR